MANIVRHSYLQTNENPSIVLSTNIIILSFAYAVQMVKIVRLLSKICEFDGYINNPNKHQLIAN